MGLVDSVDDAVIFSGVSGLVSDYHARPTAVLSEGAFIAFMMDVLLIAERPTMESRLLEDLALDSLAVYELLIAIEELECRVDEEDWVASMTVGDCYRSYRSAMSESEG